MSRLSLRVRLVAGFAAAMLVLLTAAGAFVYWRVEYALDRGLDTELSSAARVVAPVVGSGGRIDPATTADATGAGWQVLDAEGRVLDSGGPAPDAPLLTRSQLGQRTVDVGSLLPVTGTPYRVRVVPLTGDSPAAYLLLAVRRDHRDEALRELLLQLTLAGLGALVVASLVGDLLARAALRPVERYRRRAAEIAAGAAGLRLDVPPQRDDEVTRLGHTLNEMLGELEASLARERQFVDDASHELRTPLTLLRSRIQLTRRRPRSVAEHEQALDELAVDVGRLADLADQLLALQRDPTTTGAETDVALAAHAVVDRWRVAHPHQEQDVRATTESARAAIDPSAVERVVTNLVTNALTHGRPPVEVSVRRHDGWVVLGVADDGDGMPADLLRQATRRFNRAPEARARPGAGLGLAIVERLVAEAGGELRLCSHGEHVSHGPVTGQATGGSTVVPCRHGAAMTVTVVLPGAPAA